MLQQRLPTANQGEVVFETGILLPGRYRIAIFLEKHNQQVPPLTSLPRHYHYVNITP